MYQHIREMGQLVLISVELARADIHVGVSSGLCSHGADHAAQVVIEAGIDFVDIEQEDTSYDWNDETYSVQLPPPALTSCRVEYIRQYDSSRTWCGVDWDMVRLLGEAQSMQAFVDRSLDTDILGRAGQQASIIVGSFVHALTGSKTHITFAERDGDLKLPLSCQPEIPDGWQYSDESRTWSRN